MSHDPLGIGGGDANLYAYVGNDPINFSDPLGLGPSGSGGGRCPGHGWPPPPGQNYAGYGPPRGPSLSIDCPKGNILSCRPFSLDFSPELTLKSLESIASNGQIVIGVSATLSQSVFAWDFVGGFSKSVFFPIALGGGVFVGVRNINAPPPILTIDVGLGKELGASFEISRDPDTGMTYVSGILINVGPSVGLPGIESSY